MGLLEEGGSTGTNGGQASHGGVAEEPFASESGYECEFFWQNIHRLRLISRSGYGAMRKKAKLFLAE